MSGTAKLSNYRQSPRKVRLLAGLVRGKTVDMALAELQFANKRAATPFAKLLKSALVNAGGTLNKAGEYVVKDARVDGGVVMKRSMPRARGSAFPILKRTSHVIITVDAKAVSPVKAKTKKAKSTK